MRYMTALIEKSDRSHFEAFIYSSAIINENNLIKNKRNIKEKSLGQPINFIKMT